MLTFSFQIIGIGIIKILDCFLGIGASIIWFYI